LAAREEELKAKKKTSAAVTAPTENVNE
jgi:hypothetical protein